jgi:PAS domain S-box-containing protein
LHGIPAEGLIGKTNQEIGVPEHYGTFWKERIQKVFQTAQTIEEEHEFPTTSGKRIYQSRLVPEKAKDGAVTSVLMVSRDVTDRKRAEEMLQEYQKAVESSQDMIAVVDRNYRYLIVNKAFLKYRGVDREQIIGRPVSEVLGKDAFEEIIKKNFDTCLQGKVVQYEMKWTYPELGERDLSVSYFPIESPEGINRVATVIRDITELKRIEETLRESETRRRLNAQVLIAQENERKLIASEIHDGFGSQLATIKYKVEDFLRQIDKDVIGRAGESMESIIPILQESIQEARRIQMNLRPSILDDLGILPTMEWFFRTFEETYPKIKVEKEIIVEENDVSPSLRTVIYRTLQEAMNNIAKHSKADVVHLSLRKTEGKIELLVQDNGRGFDLKAVVGSERSTQGFGLVSMRERTELSGGSFSIDSTEGGGTTVRVSWPLRIAS